MAMTRTELLEWARAITGRCLLGHVSVSERAYDELGPARCLDLVRRYADVDGPDADGLSPVPAPGPVHQADYWRGGRHYVILTERLHQRCGPHQFWSELSRYDEAWPADAERGAARARLCPHRGQRGRRGAGGEGAAGRGPTDA